MSVDPKEQDGAASRAFWEALGRGRSRPESSVASARGREIWLQTNYNPIHDPAGRIIEVVKFASDITKA